MSNYEVGDRVRGKASGDWYTVKGVDGDKLWLVCDISPGHTTVSAERVEKVEPFFEVGKMYNLSGDTFTPVRVEKDSNGDRVAFGKVTESGTLRWTWRAKPEGIFHLWREV